MGGPHTPSVGWAAGIERLSMLTDAAPVAPRPVAVIPVGEGAEAAAIVAVQVLRRAGVAAEVAYKGNTKRRMERANKLNARAAVLIGEDEAARGVVQLKVLDAGTQREVALAELASALADGVTAAGG